jgi:predicted dehydrogenase/threonine dehydrogenase-like Zn-dependent dehydrogenase
MRQVIQSFKTGETILEEVPAPEVKSGHILIRTKKSLVSLGTERMLVEFGRSSLISKARQQPDKVAQVLDKIKTDGLLPTLETVFNKLGEPLPLGYCNVGVVEEVGKGVSGFKVGDRVASNGPHAEWVCVPENLASLIPDNVSNEEASFTVIGSIGLQGIRLCNPTFGETIVVTGLGLIGLLTAQMLVANGCNVIGIDLDAEKCRLAREFGVRTLNPREGVDVVKSIMDSTNNVGADGVIITASAKGNTIIKEAAQMSRKRGRIILVGVTGLDISRADFYEKELSFQVSCSYGPGRYDADYESKGIDYPLAFVRWTEQRNFSAILKALSTGKLQVASLITEKIALKDYQKIYGEIGQSKSIATILDYGENNEAIPTRVVEVSKKSFKSSKGVIGIIGAGNFTKMTMLPSLSKAGANIKTIASAGGLSGTTLAKKFAISQSTTSTKEIFEDAEISTVLVTTRHNSHSRLVIEALENEKHVFVEKPLALNPEELNNVIRLESKSAGSVTVGFNRRFSPHIKAIKKSVGSSQMNIIATMNAGFIPSNVWVHDMDVGGGRVIGEACHYMDLCVHMSGSKIESVCMQGLGTNPQQNTDNVSILLKFENGSTAVINYFSNGSKSYSKERLEVYSQERTFVMDNFRATKGFGARGFKNIKTKQDKGHNAQFEEYNKFLKEGGEPLIKFEEIVNVTRASFAALLSLREGRWVHINEYEA